MADDDPVGEGTDVPTVLERLCAAGMTALSPLRFAVWLSPLELLRVGMLVEAARPVVVSLAIVASVFEGLVLFDGASFCTSLFLFVLVAARPLFFPISAVGDSESIAAR